MLLLSAVVDIKEPLIYSVRPEPVEGRLYENQGLRQACSELAEGLSPNGCRNL
jgi:hypothetical protein